MENTVHQLDALAPGLLIAGRTTPKGWDEGDALVRNVHAAVDALVQLNATKGSLDPNMLPERQREALTGQHAATLLKAQRAKAATEAAAKKLAEAEAALYTPPSVADAGELRAVYRAAGPEERKRYDDLMVGGHAPALVAALASFPIGADSVRARDLFRAQRRAADPRAVEHLEAAEGRLSWAQTWLREVDGALDKATLHGNLAAGSTIVTA